MNFVRFVKTPRVSSATAKKSNSKGNVKKSSNSCISTILTITTDFSSFAGSTELLCRLASIDNSILAEQKVQWSEYDREIKVEFPIPSKVKEVRMIVSPESGLCSDDKFLSRFLGGGCGHIVGLESEYFTLSNTSGRDTVFRQFFLPQGPLRIAEHAGETIIRHVWDAGVILSATLSYSSTCLPVSLDRLVHSTLKFNRDLKVLELGTGVGILGITIAGSFPTTTVVMTDLPDAQSLVEENIHLNLQTFPHLKRNASFRALDWEQKPFPSWTDSEKYDLIVMADVTYNTATFSALADTLEHLLRNGSKGAKVLCCGKRRHDEEEGFWNIVRKKGITIDERIVFARSLEGGFQHRAQEEKNTGEQLIDFVVMTLK